jgi:hypothetical protein
MRVINPDLIIHTGYLVDNYDSEPEVLYSSNQNETHWKIYTDIRSEFNLSPETYIEILGNHDVWSILKPITSENSPDRHFLRKGFGPVDSIIKGRTRFILYTPVTFPTGHGNLHYFAKTSYSHSELIEKEISKENADLNIMLCHFLTGSWCPKQASSKTGRTIEEIIAYKENHFVAFLNEHSHQKQLDIWHHQFEEHTAVEFTLPCLKTETNFGLFTIDNAKCPIVSGVNAPLKKQQSDFLWMR